MKLDSNIAFIPDQTDKSQSVQPQAQIHMESPHNNLETEKEEHSDLVSPMIWIPTALIAAFFNAGSKEIKSKIAVFRIAAMFLMAPPVLIILLVLFIIFWIESKFFSEQQLLDESKSRSYFDWIYNIYYVRVRSDDNENGVENQKYKFVATRVWVTIILSIIEIIHLVLIFESYYLHEY